MKPSLQLALALTLIAFATVLNSVGIVVERSIAQWSIEKSWVGSLEGCKDLTIALASLLLAAQVPAIGFRVTMLGGLLAVALSCVLLAGLQQFWTVPWLLIVCGASFALVKVAVYAILGQWAQNPQQHAAWMNRFEGIYQVGSLAAPLLFAAMIGQGNWLNTYWLVALLCALASLSWLVTPLPPAPISQLQHQGDWASLLRNPLVWVFLLAAATYVMIEQSLSTWLPTFSREVFDLRPEQAARLLSLFFGSIALSRLCFGSLVRRFSSQALQLVALGMALILLLAVLQSSQVAQPPQALAYCLALEGMLIGPIYPTLNSLMLSRLEPIQHSRMTGLIIVASALGGTLGSQLIGLISQHSDIRTAFYFPLLPMAGLIVLLLGFARLQKNSPA